MKQITVILIAVCALLSGCLTSHNNDSLQSTAETTAEVHYSSESNTESNTENTDNDTFDPDITHISVIHAEDIDPNARVKGMPDPCSYLYSDETAYEFYSTNGPGLHSAWLLLSVDDLVSWSDYYWEYNPWSEEFPDEPKYFQIEYGKTFYSVTVNGIISIEKTPYSEVTDGRYDAIIGSKLLLYVNSYWAYDVNTGEQILHTEAKKFYLPKPGTEIIAQVAIWSLDDGDSPCDSAEVFLNRTNRFKDYYKNPEQHTIHDEHNRPSYICEECNKILSFLPSVSLDNKKITSWDEFLDNLKRLDEYYSENYKNGTFKIQISDRGYYAGKLVNDPYLKSVSY